MNSAFHRKKKAFVTLLGQMDWYRGLRAATALCLPLVLGDIVGWSNMGWAALGGYEAIVADSGGPYRTRLGRLATLSIGGAIGLGLGSFVGNNLHLALPVTLFWCFLWSYLPVLGQPFSSAGVLVNVVYICGIGAPSQTPREAVTMGLLLLGGGLWSVLLSLILWPVDPYRPARSSVADCYEALAGFLSAVAELSRSATQSTAEWRALAKEHQYRVRHCVEIGWQAVAAVRAEHQSETTQGFHLVVLLENADLLIARTVALAEHFEATASDDSCHHRGLTGFEELRSTELWIADLLHRRAREENWARIRARAEGIQRLPRSLEENYCAVGPSGRFLLSQITETAALLETAIESAALLRLGAARDGRRRGAPEASVGHTGYVYARLGELRQGWNLGQLVANFRPESLLFRHALRVSLVCSLDVFLISVLHIDHGYWLLLTSLIVLQPHVSGTLRRGLERIVGTVGGGALAAILAATLHAKLTLAAALFPLALLSLAVLPVNYTAFCFFLTPAFVLAWLPYSGDWQLALVRTGNTIAGAILAVLSMLFLFPTYERERAPRTMAASLRADREYIEQVAEQWRNGQRSQRLLAHKRRATGLAHNSTEESLERLLSETWPRRRPFAQFATAFVTYLRRFAQSTTTLAAIEGEWEWKRTAEVVEHLELLKARLAWLETEILSPSEAHLWPADKTSTTIDPISLEAHPGERQLARMLRQSEILRHQLLTLRQKGWLPGQPATEQQTAH